MIARYAVPLLLLGVSIRPAIALDDRVRFLDVPSNMVAVGAELSRKELKKTEKLSFDNLGGLDDRIITDILLKISQAPVSEKIGGGRSAKDAQIYRAISPSVVLILTKEGLGSGSLVSASGEVLTNYHVVKGYDYVAVVFKPVKEGSEPTRDDIKRGQVVKYDEISDLALVRVAEVPTGKSPIRLGATEEISIGADVSAIGHPTGEAWTYTRGVISQYRLGYVWGNKGEDIKHKADIIQTQTPINPGNSGGPLISDSGSLIGVNSFKAEGEALNFAVSVDEVRRFLAQPDSRIAQKNADVRKTECIPREQRKFRNQANDSSVVSYDMFCNGKNSGEYVIPDKTTSAILLRMDRNGDGKSDVIFYDLKRRGKWDISFWDENFTGEYTLVGYHDDGSLNPSSFENYATYKRRLASSH
jgi:S1-C subfamily serine protease